MLTPSTQRLVRRVTYVVFGVIFVCMFVTPQIDSIGRPIQIRLLYLGLFLLGLIIFLGAPIIWISKTPLQGKGLDIRFEAAPIIYRGFLIVFGAMGLAITILGGCLLLGIHLAPGF